jgi:serine/threonine protein kinase
VIVSKPATNIFDDEGQTVQSAAGPAPTHVSPVKPVASARLKPGDQFGDYRILRELGRGGFATVYLAQDVPLDRRIALKVSEIRGLGEGQALAELEHEHIVQVHAQFTEVTTGKHCLCLQYVPGTTLERVIDKLPESPRPQQGSAILEAIGVEFREEVPFDPRGIRNREVLLQSTFASAVCWIGKQLAEALQFAHRRGVLHCDIKPANVLMNPYGRPLLADFNVSLDARKLGEEKAVGGTLPYMSPEQLILFFDDQSPPVDARSDLYSLGVVLFELLTGEHPFPLPHHASIEDRIRLQWDFGPAVSWQEYRIPPVLERILRRCLEPEVSNRYADAGELARALNNAFDLLAKQQALPPGGRLTAWAQANPILTLSTLTLLPQLIGSVVNFTYNTIEVPLVETQKSAFKQTVLAYNLLVYPLAIAAMLRLVIPVFRGWKKLAVSGAMIGEEIDQLRQRSLSLAPWGIILAMAGWLPGGLIFPAAIDALVGTVGWKVYLHFLISFTLSGLIALIYSHFGIQYVVLRIIYPQLGNADTYSPEQCRSELRRATRWLVPFQGLATIVPLAGALLLVAVAGEMTLSFRILIVSLIILGMLGLGIAIGVTQRLQQIVQVLRG